MASVPAPDQCMAAEQFRCQRKKLCERISDELPQLPHHEAEPGAGMPLSSDTVETSSQETVLAVPGKTNTDNLSSWALQRAASFCAERDLASWVASQNDAVGIAPSTAMVWAAKESFENSAKTTKECVAASSGWSARRACQWVRRWRRRWLHDVGRTRPGTVLQPGEVRQKVLDCSTK